MFAFARASCLIGAIAGVLALAGCGGSSSSGGQPATVAGVRATLTRFIHDLTSGNGKDACALMDAHARADLRGISGMTSCQKTIAVAQGMDTSTAAQRAQLARYLKTVHITVHGDRATVPSTGGDRTEVLLYRNGGWLFDNS